MTCVAFCGQTDSQKKGEDFNDEHIYFRNLMRIKDLSWIDSLHKLYAGRMVRNDVSKDGKRRLVKNARLGFFIRKYDGQYYIAPSIYTTDRKEDFITIKDFQTKDAGKISENQWAVHARSILQNSQRIFADIWGFCS